MPARNTLYKKLYHYLHIGNLLFALSNRSLERPYKSGVSKIIGSVDKVGNHCLSAASLRLRPTDTLIFSQGFIQP
jgi:hypothetical protein